MPKERARQRSAAQQVPRVLGPLARHVGRPRLRRSVAITICSGNRPRMRSVGISCTTSLHSHEQLTNYTATSCSTIHCARCCRTLSITDSLALWGGECVRQMNSPVSDAIGRTRKEPRSPRTPPSKWSLHSVRTPHAKQALSKPRRMQRAPSFQPTKRRMPTGSACNKTAASVL